MMTIKASEYKDQIPLLSEDDYDKTLEELIFDYMHGDGMDDEPFEGAGYCLCHVCQVVAAVATCMHVELMERRDPWTRIDPADPGTLPEDYTLVIASTKGGKTADANYDHGKFYYDDGKEIRGVIAWQLWPEPYKE